ncbi:2-dehydro-3-deoxygalactonokinase [Blastopirellula sp. J2-11]|uniref:2-dehydro-3-deoxygalactonokinase n=1 Tax=Blastopirellula sp. J2-11 TaxID=2943192 RepID=UPI0021CA0E8D|nr:2-dehydro-3-deoxygalactonokinase [Blastopirellula sp. J2-11]UUO04335.1 2-dehydro-3-deoxygalactonokinase [Blastopirellula sp. J2-11]
MAPYFFNCDWGTSHFRLRLVQAATGAIVFERASAEGAANLAKSTSQLERGAHYAKVLSRHVDAVASQIAIDAEQTPILISGMASSSIGWSDLPYAMLPFRLDGSDLPWRKLEPISGHPLYLFSGVRADCDVMRGEEMEAIGLGVLTPDLLQTSHPIWLVLPGTHSKHLCIQYGRINDFRTYMTGELYQLLQEQSSLRHSLPLERTIASQPSASEQAAFCAGVEKARRGDLTSAIFQVRAKQLLHGDEAAVSAALLSGIIIGDELAALARLRTDDSSIVLCAGATFHPLYRQALEVLGLGRVVKVVPPRDVDHLSALGQWKLFEGINRATRNHDLDSPVWPSAIPSPASFKPTSM